MQAKTRIGVQRQRDGTFHVFVNGEDQGVAAMDIPQVRCDNLNNYKQVYAEEHFCFFFLTRLFVLPFARAPVNEW